GSQQMRYADFLAVENLHLRSLHIGRAQKEFHRRLLAHPLEVNSLHEQIPEWIEVERIELIGRGEVSHRLQEDKSKRMLQAVGRIDLVDERGCQRALCR